MRHISNVFKSWTSSLHLVDTIGVKACGLLTANPFCAFISYFLISCPGLVFPHLYVRGNNLLASESLLVHHQLIKDTHVFSLLVEKS